MSAENEISADSATGQPEFSYRRYAWKQFRKNKPAYFSFWILLTLGALAILSPYIANERPLYASYKGQSLFPAFSLKNNYRFTDPTTGDNINVQLDIADWKHMEFESVWWAPVPWSATTPDPENRNCIGPSDPQLFVTARGDSVFMPSRFKHRMGTTENGTDVLAALISGTRISLSIGFISMGIAALIGLFLGAVAGYFGDHRARMKRGQYYFILLSLPFSWFYAFSVRSYVLKDALANSGMHFLFQLIVSILIVSGVTVLFAKTGKLISRGKYFGKYISVPLDSIISRVIEIMNSIPVLIIVITLAALTNSKSIVYVMIIIGLTAWTGIARFTRAEFLRIREMDYISAAEAMGFKEKRIIFRHALVNGLAPSLVSIAFGIAAAILIESALSFLGLGSPDETMTWGKLLNQGRNNVHAWWLIVYPGLAIFLTVTVYNLIGEGLRDALDPKLKGK